MCEVSEADIYRYVLKFSDIFILFKSLELFCFISLPIVGISYIKYLLFLLTDIKKKQRPKAQQKELGIILITKLLLMWL